MHCCRQGIVTFYKNWYLVCCLPWASYQNRETACCACAGNAGNVFPAINLLQPTQWLSPTDFIKHIIYSPNHGEIGPSGTRPAAQRAPLVHMFVHAKHKLCQSRGLAWNVQITYDTLGGNGDIIAFANNDTTAPVHSLPTSTVPSLSMASVCGSGFWVGSTGLSRIIAARCFWTHYVSNNRIYFSLHQANPHLICLYKLNCNRFNHNERPNAPLLSQMIGHWQESATFLVVMHIEHPQ